MVIDNTGKTEGPDPELGHTGQWVKASKLLGGDLLSYGQEYVLEVVDRTQETITVKVQRIDYVENSVLGTYEQTFPLDELIAIWQA